jgi:hypothetical protein
VVLPAVHVLVELSPVVVVPVGDAASAVPPTPGLPAVVPVVVPVVVPEADGEPVVLVVPAAVSEPVPEADAGLTLLVPSKAEG